MKNGKMMFRVYSLMWGGGGVEPRDILRRYVASVPTETPQVGNAAPGITVEVAAEELMAMATAQEFDILISGDLLAFDGKGCRFRQR